MIYLENSVSITLFVLLFFLLVGEIVFGDFYGAYKARMQTSPEQSVWWKLKSMCKALPVRGRHLSETVLSLGQTSAFD